MRSKMNKMIIMLSIFCMSLLMSVVGVNAASENDGCTSGVTQAYTAAEVREFLADKDTYPTKEGYLFAGWYTTDTIPEEETKALKCVIRNSVPDDVTTVYALFVPTHILNVKAQLSGNLIDTDTTNNDSGSIRFVTTVNSLIYKQAGFEMTYVDGSGVKRSATSISRFVYEKLYAIGSASTEDTEYVPTDFCALSQYFRACTIKNIPSSNYSTPFTVTPFWITMDGSTVYGEPVIKSINDYFLAEDVYVSTSAADVADADGYGTEAKPYATMNYAFSKVKNQGTVHVVGSYTTTADFVWEDHDKTANITGGTIDFTTLPVVTLNEAGTKTVNGLDIRDSVTFTSTTLIFEGSDAQQVYANGNTLEIASDVTWGNEEAYIRVYGGAHTEALKSDTNLILGAGQYTRIFGAGNYSNLTGDVKITLSGEINPGITYADHSNTYGVFGGGQNGAKVTGDINIAVVDDTVYFNRIYGGSHNVDVTGDVSIEFAGKAMGVYGGGLADEGKTTGAIIGDTHITMTGGWVRQIFGGCQGVSMTGNTNIDVQGGTIQRRIYGGCYNELSDSGTWSEPGCFVTGHTNVALSKYASLPLDYTETEAYIITYKPDNALYSISRYGEPFVKEWGAFIFNEDDYEDTYEPYKIGQRGNVLESNFSERTHDYLILTNGNTKDGSYGDVSSEGDYIRIKPRYGYSATVTVDGIQEYYTESEAVFKLPEFTEKTDPSNIRVTFGAIDSSVDKFSYEARIDGAYYDTFVEALAAVEVLDSKDTVTITVLKNIEIAAQVDVDSKLAIQNEPGTDITIYRGSGLAETDMFNVTSKGTLTLAGVEDRNSLVFDGRTMAEVEASTSLDSVVGSTGSLINNAGKLKIKNVTLQYAKNISDDDATSGAVNSAGTSAEIENTIFANNNASGYSGAIFVSDGKLTLKNVDFLGNSGTHGGALRANPSTTVFIEKCTFGEENGGNIASSQGGAIYNYKANITIVDTVFEYNESKSIGGAIYNNVGTIDIKNSMFANSKATSNGGAIHTGGAGSLKLTALNENNDCSLAKFSNNISDGNGGAVSMTNGSVEIIGYRFENNQAKLVGGAIRKTSGTLTVSGATFDGNSTTGTDGYGGAIYVNAKTAEITASTFKNNHTDGKEAHGGAIYINAETAVNENVGIVNTFTDNTVNGEGSKGNHIYVNVSSTLLTENPENGAGTGKETDENITFGE